jgi:glycosyltransferase involved in cell wall biosynthesis
MRIGVLPSFYRGGGGVYQYSQNILHALNVWSKNGCDDQLVLLSNNATSNPVVALDQDRWEIRPVVTGAPPPMKDRILDGIRWLLGEGPHRDALRWLRGRLASLRPDGNPKQKLPDLDVIEARHDLRDCFSRLKLNLLLYPYPTPISFESGMPYVMAVHDLQHRLQPEFPEVSADGVWEYREYLFRNGCRYATLIIADSEVGKEDVLNFYGPYGITEDQIKVLPYLPAHYLAQDLSQQERRRVRTAYQLPDRYLFYPAQFWPHKNHARLVEAVGLIRRQHHMDVSLVFCGSHSGDIRENNYKTIMSLRSSLGVENEVRDLGYVPEEDMSVLYAEAIALVMPTFFGPTNIPVLEAWAFGCPVLTSDIRGIREQVGDAAVLVNPRSVESIAAGIYLLWTDDGLRSVLSDVGRRRLSAYTPEDFCAGLTDIIKEAKDRLHDKTH